MTWHDFDWMACAIAFLAFWARLEHRFTKLEVKVDYLERNPVSHSGAEAEPGRSVLPVKFPKHRPGH